MSCPATTMSPGMSSPGMTSPGSSPNAAPARRGPSTVAARAGDLIRRAWYAYWDWRARKATVLLLSALDQRTLHDIGIASSEIESLVYGAGDRCRRYDATWRRRHP